MAGAAGIQNDWEDYLKQVDSLSAVKQRSIAAVLGALVADAAGWYLYIVHAYIHTILLPYILTHIRTCILTYIHDKCIHIYILRTYMHTYVRMSALQPCCDH